MIKNVIKNSVAIVMVGAIVPAQVFAADMPWNKGLNAFKDTLTGPTATTLITIAIAVAGLGFAFGEQGGFMRKAAGVVFGGAVALGAVALESIIIPS